MAGCARVLAQQICQLPCAVTMNVQACQGRVELAVLLSKPAA